MTPEDAAKLRAPFPPEQIGQLPKGGKMFDFVGHAVVTDRLLAVDPDWTWDPPTSDELARLPGADGMWIKLTVCGVTRFGFGDGKNVKEWISDAIRNGAMRFGVALDCWSGDADLGHNENAGGAGTATPASVERTAEASAPPASVPTASKSRVATLQSKLIAMQADGFKVARHRTDAGLPPLNDDCTDEQLDGWAALLNAQDSNLQRTNVA